MLNRSNEFNERYAAKIVRIESIEPIDGADRIVRAFMGVESAIVAKSFKVGDVVVMFPSETAIAPKYLSYHNLYERSEYQRNNNHEQVEALIEQLSSAGNSAEKNEINAQIKQSCGFFNKHGRVRCIKLRGEYSLYYIASVESLKEVWPTLNEVDFAGYDGLIFDSVGDEKICWKYVPPVNVIEPRDHNSQHRYKRSQRKLKRFDRIIPEQFKFHYDTGKLVDNVHVLHPYSNIDITIKYHGSSVILANVLVNRKLNWFEKIKKALGFNVPTTEYGNIYSSRRVIKNQYINEGVTDGFYKTDIWACVNRDFAEFLVQGMTVYGEIVGYVEGTNTFIQKDHDYGCEPGEWKFMPYRITTTDEYGDTKEWNITQVIEWTDKISKQLEDDPRKNRLTNLVRLYHGAAGKMYNNLWMEVLAQTPEQEYEEQYKEFLAQGNEYIPKYLTSYPQYVLHKWHRKLIEAMQNDREWLGMEENEPLCKHKVPREGVVVRINDPATTKPMAFKLKSAAHYGFESAAADNGEIDTEA